VSTQQINIRVDTHLAAALDRVAREESLDRATAIRRLLERSVKSWELEHAILGRQRGELSIGRAAEESGLSVWELLDATRVAGLAHPLTADEARNRLDRLAGPGERTLPDRPPSPGGVLLVGINPAPVSVAAGHYYQGRLGRRLWRRLQQLGLLDSTVPGAEDDAFVAAGNGLTDLVKRPTASADLLSPEELRAGTEILRGKIRDWRPRVVLFAFRAPAVELIGRDVQPGACGDVEGFPAFLLSGP
jgi:TDG/mug DNA glycosylase family protein